MLGSIQPKLNWVGAGGILTFLTGAMAFINQLITYFKSLTSGNINQVTSLSGSAMVLIYGLIITSFFLSIVYIAIRRFNNFNIFGKSILADEDGKLFITKVVGTCNVCNSPTKLSGVGNSSSMVCAKNQSHYTPFDWTLMKDISEEYKQRTNNK